MSTRTTRIRGVMGHQGDVEEADMDSSMKATLGIAKPDTARRAVSDTTRRVAPPKPKPKNRDGVRRAIADIRSGTSELFRQGKAAVEKVKESYRKVKKHLGG